MFEAEVLASRNHCSIVRVRISDCRYLKFYRVELLTPAINDDPSDE